MALPFLWAVGRALYLNSSAEPKSRAFISQARIAVIITANLRMCSSLIGYGLLACKYVKIYCYTAPCFVCVRKLASHYSRAEPKAC